MQSSGRAPLPCALYPELRGHKSLSFYVKPFERTNEQTDFARSTREHGSAISFKTKHETTVCPRNCPPGHTPGGNENLGSHKALDTMFHAPHPSQPPPSSPSQRRATSDTHGNLDGTQGTTLSGERQPKGHTLKGPVYTTLEMTVTETQTGEWPGKGLGKKAHGDGTPRAPPS